VTALLTYYALHDALVKPMPGAPMAPSLAETWSMTRDGLVYEFVLRRRVRFHDGSPLTAEDVRFSLERYRGVSSRLFRERVAAVETLEPHRVRFRPKQPWPDFMTFFATPATGAAWIVPKAYVERVGDEGFRKAPMGAGPYRFVASVDPFRGSFSRILGPPCRHRYRPGPSPSSSRTSRAARGSGRDSPRR
jgi:peptide/nickel transport system substrate-binding protein